MSENDQWVTSREGAALLGIPQSNFLYYVKTGDIAARQGRKHREYNRADVIKIRRAMLTRTKRTAPEPALIDWILPADVPAGLTLAQRLYGPDIDLADLAVYQSWRKHNQYISLGAFSPDRSECYASIQIVPLAESVILDVLSNRRVENSITPDEIRAYDEPGPYTLLATSALCLPDRPMLLYELLDRYMDYWIDMYPNRYMKRIYAQAMSERGVMLIQHFFCAPRLDLAYNAYMLDFAVPSASKVIQRFKAHLQEKAPLPPDLRWPPETPAPPPAHHEPEPIQSRPETQETPSPVSPLAYTPLREKATTAPQETRQGAFSQGNLPVGYVPLSEFYHGMARSTAKRNAALTEGDWRDATGHVINKALSPEQQHAYYLWAHNRPGFVACPECPHLP